MAKTLATIFFIENSAKVFNRFLSAASISQIIASYFIAAEMSPWMILIGMLLIYLALGTVMNSLAIIILTVPISILMATQHDFGISPSEVEIWFGILVLMSA